MASLTRQHWVMTGNWTRERRGRCSAHWVTVTPVVNIWLLTPGSNWMHEGHKFDLLLASRGSKICSQMLWNIQAAVKQWQSVEWRPTCEDCQSAGGWKVTWPFSFWGGNADVSSVNVCYYHVKSSSCWLPSSSSSSSSSSSLSPG